MGERGEGKEERGEGKEERGEGKEWGRKICSKGRLDERGNARGRDKKTTTTITRSDCIVTTLKNKPEETADKPSTRVQLEFHTYKKYWKLVYM